MEMRVVPRRVKLPALLVVVLLLALAAGLFSVARGATGQQRGNPPPAVLHWADEGVSDLVTLDPVREPDANALLAAQLIYGGLVRFGPGFRILPDAAARWQISPDRRVYTFYLRPNVRFGDGTPLTASDVAYSLNRTLSAPFAYHSGAYLLSDIDGAAAMRAGRARVARGITVLDARTIRIRLRRGSGSFLAQLATYAGYIVPRWRIQAHPQTWDQQAEGTGPFMVARWVHNNALLLVPNPYYYGGTLRLGGIDMPFIAEPLTAYKRYRAGALDIMGTVHFPTDVLYDVQEQPDYHPSVRLETVYVSLNRHTTPLGDARVRLALAHAVDRAALARDVYGTLARPATGMVPYGLPGYTPTLSGDGYDPALARRLLAAAGYPHGQGLPPITYAVDQDAQSLVLATALAAQWKRVLGLSVILEQYDHPTYLTILRGGTYQIATIDRTADYPDPQDFLSQTLRTGVPDNDGDWSDPAFDRLVDRADSMSATNPARYALYQRAEGIAMAQAATIPLVNPASGILMRPRVHGLQISGGHLLAADWTRVTVTPAGSP